MSTEIYLRVRVLADRDLCREPRVFLVLIFSKEGGCSKCACECKFNLLTDIAMQGVELTVQFKVVRIYPHLLETSEYQLR